MNIFSKGVLPNSCNYFHTPSNTARSMFFYLKCVGNYYCDSDYLVKREDYNSFLLMYVKSGKGTVQYEGKTFNVQPNDVVFLNCHKPHLYTTDKWETLWLHFDGNTSSEYFNLLYDRGGVVVPQRTSTVVPTHLNLLLDNFKGGASINEPMTSCYIQRMLTELLLITSDTTYDVPDGSSPIQTCINYIQSHYKNKLTLEQLATTVNLSPFYFSRLFKKETGYSPYEYIIMTRLNAAKTLLKGTRLPIKEIAFSTGFHSESNFVTCFKNNTNATPREFRNISI